MMAKARSRVVWWRRPHAFPMRQRRENKVELSWTDGQVR